MINPAYRNDASLLKRSLILAYGVVAYLCGIFTLAYSFGFIGNLFVPRSIDSLTLVPLGDALAVNVSLLLLFGLQHSGMAQPAFRAWVTRVTPMCTERSTYVLFSCAVLIALMVFWQPMGVVVWSVENRIGQSATTAAFVAGCVLVIWATYLIDHLELLGLRQTWCTFRKGDCGEPRFRTPGAYRLVRHPVHTGWLVVLWASPTMTQAHLILAIGVSFFIVLGTYFEEHSLEQTFESYGQYKRKVPRLLPSFRRRLVPATSDE